MPSSPRLAFLPINGSHLNRYITYATFVSQSFTHTPKWLLNSLAWKSEIIRSFRRKTSGTCLFSPIVIFLVRYKLLQQLNENFASESSIYSPHYCHENCDQRAFIDSWFRKFTLALHHLVPSLSSIPTRHPYNPATSHYLPCSQFSVCFSTSDLLSRCFLLLKFSHL